MKNRIILVIILLLILLLGVLFGCNQDSGPYTITFDTDGGSPIDAFVLQKGDLFNPPEPPIKSGYTFYGWYYDKAYTYRVDSAAFKATKNLTLYAKWENNENIPHEIVFTSYDFADFYTNITDNLAIFNQTIEVTISPKPGYRIADGTVIASSPNTHSIVVNKVRDVSEVIKVYSFKMPSERVEISSSFVLRDYSLSVSIMSGEGAVYLDTNTAKMQEEVTYIVVPEAGYQLKEILVDGNTLRGEPYTMKAQDALFFVYFEKLDFDRNHFINIIDSEGGRVFASASSAYKGAYIYLDAVPDEGYKLDGFFADGYPVGDYFIMPSYSVSVEGSFSPIDNEISYSLLFDDGDFGLISAERENYSQGERVELLVEPQSGYYLEALFVNDRYIPNSTFIMPSEDVVVRGVFLSTIGSEEYSIAIVVEGGTIQLNRTSAQVGQGVSIKSIVADIGYKFVEGSLRYNGNVFDTYFIMPNQAVTISCEFEAATLYKITAYESSKGYFIPNKSYAYQGELITVTVRAKPGYLDTEGNFTLIYWEDGRQVVPSGLTFVMPSADIDLEGDFSPRPSAKRAITVVSSEGGTLSTNYNSAPFGTLIHISALPAKGYKLSRLYHPILVMGDRVEVPLSDSFIMPDFDISINAVFTRDDSASFTLESAYNANKYSLISAGIKVDYYDKHSQIAQFLYGNGADAAYIDALIYIELNTAALIFEINDISQMARITQGLMVYYSTTYPNTNFKTMGNIFIVSIGGNAQTDYQLLLSGAEVYNNFVLYPCTDGTYGALAYVGNSIYVSVPFTYNGRSISRLEAGAFMQKSDIVKLLLGSVREVATGAFDGLTNLTTLDLSGVTQLAPLALKDCLALTNILVDNNYNSTYYADERGVLYEKLPLNTFRLLRYPVARTETEYTIKLYTYEIAPYAFYQTLLTKITERSPTSVRIIGAYAFKDAALLSDIDLSQVLDIRTGAFLGCVKLEKVSLNKLQIVEKHIFDLRGDKLSIDLANLWVTGSNNFVQFEGNAALRLVVTPENLDNFRKNEVFGFRYSKYFTVAASALKAKEYIIMFESNGGNYINSQRRHNAIPVPPEPPIRDGFIFDGWYEDELCTIPFTFSQIYDKQVIPIFAKWEWL